MDKQNGVYCQLSKIKQHFTFELVEPQLQDWGVDGGDQWLL